MIQAFNDDLPYDQFVQAQLAGDLMDERCDIRCCPPLGSSGSARGITTTDPEVTRADERHDRVDAVTRGFLGLTVPVRVP